MNPGSVGAPFRGLPTGELQVNFTLGRVRARAYRGQPDLGLEPPHPPMTSTGMLQHTIERAFHTLHGGRRRGYVPIRGCRSFHPRPPRRTPYEREPFEVAHDPLARRRRDPRRRARAQRQPTAELRIVVDQSVQATRGRSEDRWAVHLVRIGRVVEQHRKAAVAGPRGFAQPMRMLAGTEPHTTASVFACGAPSSLLRGGARVTPVLQAHAPGRRRPRRPDGPNAKAHRVGSSRPN